MVTAPQHVQAREILGAFGDEVFVDEERFLDMATALSGTGPAYVFLFMEAMVDAGVHLGFSRRVAELLVAKTVRGSVDFYAAPDDPPAPRPPAESGHLARRHLGGRALLPREGRLPDRRVARRMGGLRALARARSRLAGALAGDSGPHGRLTARLAAQASRHQPARARLAPGHDPANAASREPANSIEPTAYGRAR